MMAMTVSRVIMPIMCTKPSSSGRYWGRGWLGRGRRGCGRHPTRGRESRQDSTRRHPRLLNGGIRGAGAATTALSAERFCRSRCLKVRQLLNAVGELVVVRAEVCLGAGGADANRLRIAGNLGNCRRLRNWR